MTTPRLQKRVTFGQHRGCRYIDAIREDPNYFIFLLTMPDVKDDKDRYFTIKYWLKYYDLLPPSFQEDD